MSVFITGWNGSARPVFQLDALYPLEVLGIVGHQRKAMVNGGGADQEVEVGEWLA